MQYGRPVELDQMKKIDLIVCGSVAVNRRGARVGKGGGYSDLEFALLTQAKKISAKTPIVTSVHPLQIVNEEMPMTDHDIPLNAHRHAGRVIEVTAILCKAQRDLLERVAAGQDRRHPRAAKTSAPSGLMPRVSGSKSY